MILNREERQYLAVKNLSALLKINVKNGCDFYCLNCLHFFKAKSKIEPHRKACQN